eukprot:scaffold11749_cov55-Attheya_sp.AAC.1
MNTEAANSVEHWRSTKLILLYRSLQYFCSHSVGPRGRMPIRNKNCANHQVIKVLLCKMTENDYFIAPLVLLRWGRQGAFRVRRAVPPFREGQKARQ